MRVIWSLILALAAPPFQEAAVPVAQERMHHYRYENEFVKVFDVVVPAGAATRLHRHDLDYAYVVLGDATIRNEVAGKAPVDAKLADGEVRFTAGGFSHVARNTGSGPFHNVTIEIKRRGPGTTPNTLAGVAGYTLILENDAVRIWDVRLAAGGTLQKHRHDADRLYVSVRPAMTMTRSEDGHIEGFGHQIGDVRWSPRGAVHTTTNVGTTDGRFVEIEWK